MRRAFGLGGLTVLCLLGVWPAGCAGVSVKLDEASWTVTPEADAWPADRPAPEWLAELPPADLPPALREPNYGGGSCMWASWIPALRWAGRDGAAEYVRRRYSGAAGIEDLAAVADRLGLEYALTRRGEDWLLEWASRTRRPAAVYYKPAHACTLLGYVRRGGEEYAVVLDNNHVSRLEFVPKERFLREWRSYGGCAVVLADSPAPPRPWL